MQISTQILGRVNNVAPEITSDDGGDSASIGFTTTDVPVGPDDDVLVGTDNDDVLDGLGGDDTINGWAGQDILNGGDGNDRVGTEGYDGREQLYGHDRLYGGDGNDFLSDAIGRNIIDGGAGDDTFRLIGWNLGDGGSDLVTGGAGADTFHIAFYAYTNFSTDIITDFDVAQDRIDVVGEDRPLDLLVTLQGFGYDPATDPFATGWLRLVQKGPDTLLQVTRDANASTPSYQSLVLMQGVTASALTSANFVGGFVPQIGQLPVGEGSAVGSYADEVLYGGDSSDLVQGNGGSDTLYGGDGNDYVGLHGVPGSYFDDSSGGNRLYGGAGDDQIYAFGNDTLSAVPLPDIATGGAGRDTFSLNASTMALRPDEIQTVDIITDFQTGADGDLLEFNYFNYWFGLGFDQNPFALGYARLVQDGADTVLRADADGPTGGRAWADFLRLENTQATAFTRDNFVYGFEIGPDDGTPVANAPIGVADSYVVAEDGSLVIAAADDGLLANDSDIDGDGLSAILVSGPAHGTVTLNADGSFRYDPTADYFGSDSFVYRASDGNLASADTTVSLMIDPVNDAPSGFSLSVKSVSEDTAQWTTLGRFAASDVDGDTLTYSLVDADGGPFSLRGLRLISNAEFDFEMRSSYDLLVAVSDGTASVQKSFHIDVRDVFEPVVNLAPTTPLFSRTSVRENTAIGTSLGLLYATDPEGGTLRWTLLDDAGGTFGLAGNKVRITGDIDYETTRQLSFTAQARDSAGNTTAQTFTLDVIDVIEPAAQLHAFGDMPFF